MDSSKYSKKECNSNVNLMEILLIFVILYFFFDLLIIEKQGSKSGFFKIITNFF